MATSKTLTPTNVTISIPAMTDRPDASVFSNCVDKEADAINALNSKIIYKDHNVANITVSAGKEAYMNIGSETGYYPITVTGVFTGETATSISVLNPTKNPSDGSWIARLHNSHSADVVANGVVTSVWIKR